MPRISTITFDTFKFVERLEKAGVPREQAVAIAEAQQQALAETLDFNLVTRGDLAKTESGLKADVTAVHSELELLRKDLQAMELRLTVKIGTFAALVAGVVIAVVRLPH